MCDFTPWLLYPTQDWAPPGPGCCSVWLSSEHTGFLTSGAHSSTGELGSQLPPRVLWVYATAEPNLLSAGQGISLVAGAGAGKYPNSGTFFLLLMAKIYILSTSLGCPLCPLPTRLGFLVFHGNFWSSRNPFLSQRLGSFS